MRSRVHVEALAAAAFSDCSWRWVYLRFFEVCSHIRANFESSGGQTWVQSLHRANSGASGLFRGDIGQQKVKLKNPSRTNEGETGYKSALQNKREIFDLLLSSRLHKVDIYDRGCQIPQRPSKRVFIELKHDSWSIFMSETMFSSLAKIASLAFSAKLSTVVKRLLVANVIYIQSNAGAPMEESMIRGFRHISWRALF